MRDAHSYLLGTAGPKIKIAKNAIIPLEAKLFIALVAPMATGIWTYPTVGWSDIKPFDLPYAQAQKQRPIIWGSQEAAESAIMIADISHTPHFATLYFIRDASEFEAFISSEPSLKDVLENLRIHIDSVFGITSQISLRVLQGYDDEGSRLSAKITCIGEIDDALSRLNQLRESWWYEASSELDGKITVDVEMA